MLDSAKEEIRELKNYITGMEEELKIYRKDGIKSKTSSIEPSTSNSDVSSTVFKESETKRQELEEKLNEILPTLSKYRGKYLEMEF